MDEAVPRHTPGRRTPGRRTPGRRTPGRTPGRRLPAAVPGFLPAPFPPPFPRHGQYPAARIRVSGPRARGGAMTAARSC
ncbi:hypothetical protein FLW16_22105 [Microbispora sp. KK1-11]|nr:hypothetical protein FLW16_22105 [Microbispora sp. KK1-11]